MNAKHVEWTMFPTNARSLIRLPSVYRRLALLALTPLLVAAEGDPEMVRIGLREALERAEKASGKLAVQRAKVARSEADLARARGGRYPRGELLSVFGVVNRARAGEVPDGLPNELGPLFSEDGADNPLNGLGPFVQNTLQLSVPIYTFGKIGHGVASARHGIEAREEELSRQAAEVRVELKRIYYGYQLAAQLHDTFGDVEDSFKQAATQAEERMEASEGRVTQADILKLKVAANGVSARVLELDRQRQVSLLAFRRAIGEDLDAPLLPAEDRIRPVEVRTLDEGDDLEALFVELPAWRAVQAGLRAREEAAAVAQSELWPDLFVGVRVQLNFAANRSDLDNPFLVDQFNILRGGPFLGLRWQLDLATKLAEKARAKAEAAEQAARVEQARSGLPLGIRRAVLKLEEKSKALKLARSSRKAGRALTFLTNANFRIGLGDPGDILEAYGVFARVTGEYYRAVFAFNMAVAELSEAIGRPVEKDLE